MNKFTEKISEEHREELAIDLVNRINKAQEEGESELCIELAGELKALYEKRHEAPVLPEVSPLISTKNTLGGLKYNGTTTVGPLTKTFDPKKFWKNDNPDVKLYIRESFEKRLVLVHAGKVSNKSGASFSSYGLTKKMNDMEIRSELPQNHVFQLDDLWIIAYLILSQSQGQSGELLNNRYANLFYVQVGALVFVVSVGWRGSGWRVDGWDLGEDGSLERREAGILSQRLNFCDLEI